MKAKLVAALLTGAAMLIAAPMWASLYDFTVCSNITTLGVTCPASSGSGWDSGKQSLSYTDGIVATGYLSGPNAPSGPTGNISIKTLGSNETGLGLVGDSQNNSQISSLSTLVLNLSALSFTSGSLELESEQATEGAQICFSTTGAVGTFTLGCFTQITAGPATVDVPINWAGHDFVAISGAGGGGKGDVLVHGLTTPVPEPGSLVLFGSGLLGLGTFLRRRFQA